ncbi:hypothetical protein KP509_27G016500 [Ceratopteris richardii]|nr:hypothetical protein KP509_27G016500 [Ceratopteris richardii]
MEDFVERSVKVLDVCRDIKEQITDVESLEVMLREVSPCLASKRGTGFAQGQVARAKRLLSQLLLQMEIEKVDEKPRQVEMRISFRGKLRERLNGHLYKDGSPQRWRSWPGHQDPAVPHGPGGSDGSAPSLHTSASAGHFSPSFSSSSNSSSGTGHQAWHGTHASHSFSAALSHASEVSRSLQSLELSPPKLVTRDEEECFAAAIYAFNAVSVFFLGTITASFPNLGSKTHVISTINPPSSFAWSSAFLSLQEKVQEEVKAQRQRGLGKICMWELEQVFSFMKRLSELTSSYPFPWSSEQEEDVKRVVSQFDLQIYNLGQDLNVLNAHITDFYNQIVFARFEAFEILMNID